MTYEKAVEITAVYTPDEIPEELYAEAQAIVAEAEKDYEKYLEAKIQEYWGELV